MKVATKIIGLTVGQTSFLLAEVAPKGGRNAVQQFAEFVFPEGLSLATPEKLGEALAQFLKGRKFSTKDVVIGLPAKRLLTRRKEIPAASAAVAASTLRLQAEGEFSAELDNLVMDFAGTPSSVEATTVLLIATNREVIDQCLEMAKAAGLRVQGITATTAALGRATSRLPGGDGWVLNLGKAGAELVVQHGKDPAHLRHLNVLDGAQPESIGALAGEIRRMMASIPRNGTPMTLALWNGPSMAGQANPSSLLEQRLSVPVTTPELSTLVSTDNPDADGFAPAVAVALAAMEPNGLPVDFLDSRLAPPKETGKHHPLIAGITLAVLVLGLIVWAVIDVSGRQAELKAIQASRAKNKAALASANDLKKRLDFAQSWIPKDPHFVACLRDVTAIFPPQGGTIWATALQNLRDANNWSLQGKAASALDAQNLRTAMLRDPSRFGNPQLQINEEPTTHLTSFTLTFTY